MIAPSLSSLADAVMRDIGRLSEVTLADILKSCQSLKASGVALAWGLCNAEAISQAQGTPQFVDSIFNSGVWPRVRRQRQALPIREGHFAELIEELKSVPVTKVNEVDWAETRCREAWKLVACFACNGLAGSCHPFLPGRWSKSERRLANAVGSAVDRLLSHGHAEPVDVTAVEKDLESRRINYAGEEVGKCHNLTMDQVKPALPPKEHGGSIDITKFLSASSCDFLRYPHKSVVEDVGQELPKLQGKIHATSEEMALIASELVERGVCSWIPLASVVKFRGQHVLNGMFGVEKPSVSESGKPTLRLIMNLVPSNSVLRSYEGAVKGLPQITSWMSIVLEEGQQVKVWQSDMQNAFYLFRLPSAWAPYLAFNYMRDGMSLGFERGEQFVLCCNVLPMGWTNSVALMQEASEQILWQGNLDRSSQICRGVPLPSWVTGLVHQARREGRAFWHVYLDNFAAGELGVADEIFQAGEQLHQLAEKAWAEAGVVSSIKKRKSAELQAQELGAYVDGNAQIIGGSPDRLLKLVQATLVLLSKPHLSKRLTQVVAGRWIHVFQFRRPAMSLLEKTWDFVSKKGVHLKLVRQVRRELFSCMCAVPFLHTFLGARIGTVITASDASSSGGAVGIARELNLEGKDYVASSQTVGRTRKIPVLVISLFNGIGGALRVYDLLGVQPAGVICFDLHKPANRVTGKRWPHAEIHGDVREFSAEQLRGWLRRYVPLKELHLWAGFPCTDLSSVMAGRMGLDGPASGLFWEVVRIKKVIEDTLPVHVVFKFVGENVASMDKANCVEISEHLGVQPYYLNSSDSVPMQRPRLCWTSEEIEGCIDGLEFEEQPYWTSIRASADYPQQSEWVEPGFEWTGGSTGHVLPTAMKAIKRARPPEAPAGLSRCDHDTIMRWTADNYRFPPCHYQWRFLFWKGEQWRLANSSERELLLGYGWGHTSLCMNASTIKENPCKYEDERLSLLGDSFSLFSFIIPGCALCREYLPRLDYRRLVARMGMAPGFCAPLMLQAPIARRLQYGQNFSTGVYTVEQLNRILLSKVNHTGSDVRITTGEILSPKAVTRQSVQAAWWRWEPLFHNRWRISEHINVLELRAILLAAKYQILHLHVEQSRIFHITDSFVGMSVVAKGRTGSKQLARVLKELNAWLLGFGVMMIIGHVESTENPTDGASRALAICRKAH